MLIKMNKKLKCYQQLPPSESFHNGCNQFFLCLNLIMSSLPLFIAIPLAAALSGPIFELDLFINDPSAGYQPTGWPQYLQTDAAKYMNVAGISFIQPSDLLNPSYDLPAQVAAAVKSLRSQGVTVQLLIGGEISNGWPQLISNPIKAANKSIELMKKYDCGIEIDNEAGGDSSAFIKAVCIISIPFCIYPLHSSHISIVYRLQQESHQGPIYQWM